MIAAECGVGDGLTAHFAIKQALAEDIDKVELHLFDAWAAMRPEDLTEVEKPVAGTYADLSLERTRRNLTDNAAHLRWHPGLIPETLD